MDRMKVSGWIRSFSVVTVVLLLIAIFPMPSNTYAAEVSKGYRASVNGEEASDFDMEQFDQEPVMRSFSALNISRSSTKYGDYPDWIDLIITDMEVSAVVYVDDEETGQKVTRETTLYKYKYNKDGADKVEVASGVELLPNTQIDFSLEWIDQNYNSEKKHLNFQSGNSFSLPIMKVDKGSLQIHQEEDILLKVDGVHVGNGIFEVKSDGILYYTVKMLDNLEQLNKNVIWGDASGWATMQTTENKVTIWYQDDEYDYDVRSGVDGGVGGESPEIIVHIAKTSEEENLPDGSVIKTRYEAVQYGLEGVAFQVFTYYDDESEKGNALTFEEVGDIYNQDKQGTKTDVVTGADGKVHLKFNDSEYLGKTLVLEEINAPNGYYGGTKLKINVPSGYPDNDLEVYYNLTNTARSLAINKIDEKGNLITKSDASFVLQYSEDHNTWTTLESFILADGAYVYNYGNDRVELKTIGGKLQIKGLPPGHFKLQETRAPSGYIKSDQVYPFTLSESEVKNISIDVENKTEDDDSSSSKDESSDNSSSKDESSDNSSSKDESGDNSSSKDESGGESGSSSSGDSSDGSSGSSSSRSERDRSSSRGRDSGTDRQDTDRRTTARTIDDDTTPLANVPNTDFTTINENEVPLGMVPLPQTGSNSPLSLAAMLLVVSGVIMLLQTIKRQ